MVVLDGWIELHYNANPKLNMILIKKRGRDTAL